MPHEGSFPDTVGSAATAARHVFSAVRGDVDLNIDTGHTAHTSDDGNVPRKVVLEAIDGDRRR